MQPRNASTETVLLLQEEGLQAFTQYLRKLTAQRAQDSYTSLVEGGPQNPLRSPLSLCLRLIEQHLHNAVFRMWPASLTRTSDVFQRRIVMGDLPMVALLSCA